MKNKRFHSLFSRKILYLKRRMAKDTYKLLKMALYPAFLLKILDFVSQRVLNFCSVFGSADVFSFFAERPIAAVSEGRLLRLHAAQYGRSCRCDRSALFRPIIFRLFQAFPAQLSSFRSRQNVVPMDPDLFYYWYFQISCPEKALAPLLFVWHNLGI